MKKSVFLLLGLIMALVGLSGCQQQTVAPEEQFEQLLRQNSGLSSQELDAVLELNLQMEEAQDLSADITAEINWKMIRDEQNPQMAMELSAEFQGNRADSSYYYSDGYLYQDIAGVKTKQRLPYEDFQSRMNSNSLFDLSSLAPTDLKMEQQGEDTVFTFSLSSETAQNLLQGFLSQLQTLDTTEISFENAVCQFIANQEGYFIRQTLSLNFRVTIGGQMMHGSLRFDGITVSPGQEVEISIESPQDYREA